MSIDHDLKKIIDAYYTLNFPAYSSLSPEELRTQFNKAYLSKPKETAIDLHSVETQEIEGKYGNITLRLYYPNADSNLPALMYFHGGGFVIRDNMDIYDQTCRRISRNTDCVVIAVDFHLAPEYPFPAATEDCYSATAWVYEHAKKIKVDKDKIGVWGESCGGNLVAVIALMSRDRAFLALQLQVIISPMLNIDFSTSSYIENDANFILSRDTMSWFWSHYLSHPNDKTNPYAIPKLATDHSNLPPALIYTTGLDVLRDEGKEYATCLKKAGTQVHYHCFEGLIHGFFDLYNSVNRAKLACDKIFSDVNKMMRM